MRVFHSPASALHDPDTFFRRGKLIAAPETVQRYTVLRDAVAAGGHDLVEAPDAGDAPILAVHDAAYVAFLRSAWDRRAEVGLEGDELLTRRLRACRRTPKRQARQPDRLFQRRHLGGDPLGHLAGGLWLGPGGRGGGIEVAPSDGACAQPATVTPQAFSASRVRGT